MLKAQFRRAASAPKQELRLDGAPPWQQQNPHDYYKFEQELGRGKFGITHKVTCIKTGEQYAIKAISKLQPEYSEKVVQCEVDLLSRLSAHPNIAGLHELYEDAGHRYIVMELCTGGELFDLIVARGFFTEKEVAIVARTLLQVVEYCHRQNVLHRDLKPENFLLKDRTGSIEKDNLRAIDFGLSTVLTSGNLKQIVGSAYYLAPEVLKGSYSWEADAWSVGVMLYIMLCGMPPFWGRTDGEIFKRVLEEPLDLRIDPWPEVSAPAKDLVARLLTRDVKKRISAKAALKHPWILNMANLPDKPMSSLMLTRLKQFTAMSKFKVTLLNLVAKHLNTAEIGSLKDSFLAMDEDGSGFLTADKLQNALSRCSVDPHATDVQRLMKQLDINHDRQEMPAMLSYEDFVAAALDTQRQLSAQSLAEVFSALDQDGDGFLSAEELTQGLKDCDIFANVDDIMQMMEQEAAVGKQEERKHNLQSLHRISVAGFVDIIQSSAKGELQVAQLESAARQMSAYAQSNRLKQLASLIVARTSPAEDIQSLRELFGALDEAKTGRISIAKLQEGLRNKCSLAEREIRQITSALDANNDGQVDWEAFVASAAAHQTMLSDAKLRAAFEFIDADHDGKISKEDFHHMLSELRVDTAEAEALLRLADANGDGFVDFEEFETLMNSKTVAKPNILNRMSIQPRAIPVTIPEGKESPMAVDVPSAAGASAAADVAASPVSSLMTAMESKWMAGQLTRIKTLPKRAISQVVRRHKTH